VGAYIKGGLGVDRDASALETAGAVAQKYGDPIGTYRAIQSTYVFATDSQARYTFYHNLVSPTVWWEGIKQPWQNYGQGLECHDAYLVGRGTVGIANELLAAYGLYRGGKALSDLLRARGGGGTVIETTASASPSRVYRVQGGTLPKASLTRIKIGEQGEMEVTGDEMLFVTFDDIGRARAYVAINRPGAEIISFEVDAVFVQQVRRAAVPQAQGRNYPDAPQIADPTKTSNSFGLPAKWIDLLIQAARSGTGHIER